MVGGRVDAASRARLLGPASWNQVRARRDARPRTSSARAPPSAVAADPRQSVEVGAQAVGIDAKRHGGDASAVAEPPRSSAMRHGAATRVDTDTSRTSTRHAVVMRDNERRRRDGAVTDPAGRAATPSGSRRPAHRHAGNWPLRRPSRSKPNDSYSAIAGSFHGKTWSSSLRHAGALGPHRSPARAARARPHAAGGSRRPSGRDRRRGDSPDGRRARATAARRSSRRPRPRRPPRPGDGARHAGSAARRRRCATPSVVRSHAPSSRADLARELDERLPRRPAPPRRIPITRTIDPVTATTWVTRGCELPVGPPLDGRDAAEVEVRAPPTRSPAPACSCSCSAVRVRPTALDLHDAVLDVKSGVIDRLTDTRGRPRRRGRSSAGSPPRA